jgi:hypothetical protein
MRPRWRRGATGSAFDPAIVARLVADAADILALDDERSVWGDVLAAEPTRI